VHGVVLARQEEGAPLGRAPTAIQVEKTARDHREEGEDDVEKADKTKKKISLSKMG